jgi:hypothetical protein
MIISAPTDYREAARRRLPRFVFEPARLMRDVVASHFAAAAAPKGCAVAPTSAPSKKRAGKLLALRPPGLPDWPS